MKDKYILCIQCGLEFVFSAGEQERFAARGFGPPKRCPECRDNKRKTSENIGETDRRKNWERKKRPDKYESYF